MSDNENKPIKTNNMAEEREDRYRNAERLAKSLKIYLPSPSEITKQKRGPPRDKRICQLNAAYKYIMHLENNIKDMCVKTNSKLPDDCKLVSSMISRPDASPRTCSNLSLKMRLNNSGIGLSPSRRNQLIHESSTISDTASTSTMETKLLNPLKCLRNFENIDASPILGNQNHFYNENDELFRDFEHKFGAQPVASTSKSLSRKRSGEQVTQTSATIQVDENNNEKENTTTASNCSIKQRAPKRAESCEQLEESIGRKHYFLRSTNRLKNMLIANNMNIKQPLGVCKRTATPTIQKRDKYSRQLDSSIASTRSISTPSVPNSNMSTTSSNEFDSLDTKQLIRVNLSPDQIAQLYKSNQNDNLDTKEKFDFI